MESMSDSEELKVLLERIACALEKIADALCEKPKKRIIKKSIHSYGCPSNAGNSSAFMKDYSEIVEFLTSKNIKIKSIREEDEVDEVLDNIALFMGTRYTHIKYLYNQIKRNLNTGKIIRLYLKDNTQEEISSMTQLCNNLYEIAFLEEYKYYKSPHYILYAKPNKIPKAINFLTGGWLERFVKTAVIRAIEDISDSSVPISYSYLKNIQIVLPNGDDFELDLIFKIEDEIFWFEAKTGDYQRYISKYSKVANIMKLDLNHAYLVLTDITETGTKALCGLFKMRVLRIDDFYEVFKNYIHQLKLRIERERAGNTTNDDKQVTDN